jgi:undecaprenyl-diphosphatase
MSLTRADYDLASHANAFAAHHDGWEDIARAYATVSEPLFIALVGLLCLAGAVLGRRRLLGAGLLALGSAGAALGVALVVSGIVDRPRPFVAHPEIHAFVHHAADPGFPSDHATAAFAIATVLALSFGVRSLPVVLAAIALAASRVLIGVHYPGDVLAGAMIGIVCAAAVVVLARLAADRVPQLRQVVPT